MTEPLDLRELVGDVPPEELAELREADALLRALPGPPPPLPPSVARPPAQAAPRSRSWTFARLAIAASFVLAVAAVSLAAVQWRDARDAGDDFDVRATVPLQATSSATGANGVIRLGERDADGTWELELTVSGLPDLPPGSFYVLWLAKDGNYAATCGSFTVASGTTTYRWEAAYRLDDYDEWVISARPPGLPRDPRLRPWLLHAEI